MLNLLRNVNLLYNISKNVYTRVQIVRFCSFKCLKCENGISDNKIHDFFCKGCSWPVDPSVVKNCNIYSLFKMEQKYEIDKKKLDQTHKKYQFSLHPDHHLDKSPKEMEIITSNSSLVSTFYKMLMDDKMRAKYLFELKYGKEMFRERINDSDHDQLEYIMETHEKIDAIEEEAERVRMKEEFGKKIEDAVNRIGESFRKEEPDSVLENYRNLSFYQQIYEKLNQ